MRFRRRRSWRVLPVALVLALSACTPPGLPAPISPQVTSTAAAVPVSSGGLVIGLDGAPIGFNPHAISDYSPATTAVAGLVLPSVSSVAADGTVVLNHDLVDSAAITSTDPFTVTYTLNRDAAWSDGTPITAEDFSYLRDQMVSQPGTIDPAGYQYIKAIRSLDAGKTVQVEFTSEVKDWLTLFSPLLPSHLLKDSPGGWSSGLAAGLPVSGNAYKMQGYDTTTGEITLARNDKYWGKQPGPASVVLRIGTADALIAALHRGDIQAAFVRPDAATALTLAGAAPAPRQYQVALPGTEQLVFNTVSGPTSGVAVRRAIAAGLDLGSLRSLLGGNRDGATSAVTSQLALPSATGAADPPVTTNNSTVARSDLASAGYTQGGVYLVKNGAPLRLTLSYPSGDAQVAAVASAVQSELGDIGIEVDLVPLDNRTLVVDQVAAGKAELALVMVPRGVSDGVAAASAFSCPASSSPTTLVPRLGNLSGLCNSGIDKDLMAGLVDAEPQSQPQLQSEPASTQTVSTQTAGTQTAGTQAPGSQTPGIETPSTDTSSTNTPNTETSSTEPAPTFSSQSVQPLPDAAGLNAQLWSDLPVLPLAQPTAVFVVAGSLRTSVGSGGPGWTFSGPLAGLAGWPAN